MKFDGISKLPLELRDDLAYWDFREAADAVLPRDRTGRAPLQPAPPLAIPPVVEGPLGPARRFLGAHGLQATGGAAFAGPQNLAVIALISLDSTTSTSAGPLIRYGSEDRAAWAFRLRPLGNEQVAVSLQFTAAGESQEAECIVGVAPGWHLWTCARVRTRLGLAFRVALDGRVAGERLVAAAPADVPTEALIQVGHAPDSEPLVGEVGALKVVAREVAPEESQLYWAAITEDAVRAHALVSGCEPVHVDGGGVWSLDERSWVRREIRTESDLWTIPLNQLRAVSDQLPDRAYGAALTRWTRLLRVTERGPADTAQLRARVQTELARVQDFTPAEYVQRFGPILDLEPAQLRVLEYRTTYNYDSFEAQPGSWVAVGDGLSFEGELRFVVPDRAPYEWPANGIGVRQEISGGQRVTIRASVTQWPQDPNAYAGILCQNRRGEALFFGHHNGGDLVSMYWDGFYWTNEFIHQVGINEAVILTLTLRDIADNDFLGWLGPVSYFSIVGPRHPIKAWLVLFSKDTELESGTTWALDAVEMRFPHGLEAYNWYLYRDLALPGDPDIEGAEARLQRTKPAHTEAHVTQREVLLLDDPVSLIGRTPLG